ncbi:caspase family protein [Mesorhizobium neociceri]|uniref:Caspase family protein n=1 Tax=Mesorhizobium neociceri TaxID=1307853 RepID=A0A838B8Q8_9HYPH|nr:caspase family protein [Mesorhizobium neociceri]MBA1142532.1 caspase family protein [Mesorhizobium neociceri]
MSQRAILIGVQDYDLNPLTAPAKDARDVYAALVSNKIFAPHDITTLIDDGSNADGPASKEAILAALEPLYYQEEPCDRLLVYFSGHGASWRVSPGASSLKPVLLCHGMRNFGRDGGKMIDVEELLERFRMRGPAEQIWIIDACRNLPDAPVRPVVPPTAWGDLPAIEVRRRALLYAVAPLAQAVGIKSQNSVFTRELLEGLTGQGRAAVYDPEAGSWVVTHRSICDYARARLEGGMAEWEREFKLPRIEFESHPPPRPIQALTGARAPQPREVSLKVDPAEALQAISARLEREGMVAAQWPPHNKSRPLPPAAFRFEAKLSDTGDWESLSPASTVIDTREVDEITVAVSPRQALLEALSEEHVAILEDIPEQTGLVEIKRQKTSASWIKIECREPTISFSASQYGASMAPIALRPTALAAWRSWQAKGKLQPGLWKIEAELAGERLGFIDIDLPAQTTVTLRLIASMPTALRRQDWSPAALVAPSAESPALVLSETMGPIQGAVLTSLLPLVALKAFDGRVLKRLQTPWLKATPMESMERRPTPISIALATDGKWENLQRPSIRSAKLRIAGTSTATRSFAENGELAVFSVPHVAERDHHIFKGVRDRNLARLRIPGWGRLEFAVPLIPNRVACVGIVLRAGGRFELSIASLYPGFDHTNHGRSATSRAIAIGARMLNAATPPDVDAINEAAYGKWIDPVLGALAWHAIASRKTDFSGEHLVTIARNMYAAFPSLSDSALFLYWLTGTIGFVPGIRRLPHSLQIRLAHGLLGADLSHIEDMLAYVHRELVRALPSQEQKPAKRLWRPRRFGSVFWDQPVLAASVDMMATFAQEVGAKNHWALRRRAAIPPGMVWNAAYFHEKDDRKND